MTVKTATVAFEVVTHHSFEEAVARCRRELPQEGFGILTEIDIQAKLKEKIDVDIPPNLILGACHPPSAHRALGAVPEVAVLLPCNVCVSVEERGTVIRAMNPEAAMSMFSNPELEEVAREVAASVRRAIERAAS